MLESAILKIAKMSSKSSFSITQSLTADLSMKKSRYRLDLFEKNCLQYSELSLEWLKLKIRLAERKLVKSLVFAEIVNMKS